MGRMMKRNEQDAARGVSFSRILDTAYGREGSTPSPAPRRGPIKVQADEFGDLQRLVDSHFRASERVNRLDLIIQAEAHDLHEDLIEIVKLLPPGTYTRSRLCDQLNSALAAHGWGRVYGTVE